MKKNEFAEIKGLDLGQLKLKVKSFREELATLSLDKNMKKLKDLKILAKKKKGLAQVLTVIRQKELMVELESRVESQEPSKEEVKNEKPKVEDKTKSAKAKSRKEKTSI